MPKAPRFRNIMKLLIVEDDTKISNAIKEGLEQENYIVDISHDGEQGLDMASENTYDLLILDLMLPKIDGLSLSKILRKEKINTPILMLTAKSTLENKLEGFSSGADDYLTKPFEFEELLARIRALLKRPTKLSPQTIKYDELELNLEDKTLKYKNKIIDLTKKEFQLLEFLLQNKGTVFSKERIIEKVWEYDSDVLPNNVEVYVGYLRKKLGRSNPIKTIRGFGYKID